MVHTASVVHPKIVASSVLGSHSITAGHFFFFLKNKIQKQNLVVVASVLSKFFIGEVHEDKYPSVSHVAKGEKAKLVNIVLVNEFHP